MALTVFYSYGGGDKVATVRSDDPDPVLKIAPDPNPNTPLLIKRAMYGPVPTRERVGSSRRSCASSLRSFRPDRPLSPGSLFPS